MELNEVLGPILNSKFLSSSIFSSFIPSNVSKQLPSNSIVSLLRAAPTSHDSFYSQSQLSATKIMLVIAHPDDEVMFFSPLLNLAARNKESLNISILCLSNGNFEGLGSTRYILLPIFIKSYVNNYACYYWQGERTYEMCSYP